MTSSGFTPAPEELMLLAQPPLWHDVCIVIFQREIAIVNCKCKSVSREHKGVGEGEQPSPPTASSPHPGTSPGNTGFVTTPRLWLTDLSACPKTYPLQLMSGRMRHWYALALHFTCWGLLWKAPGETSATGLGVLSRRDPTGSDCSGVCGAEPAQG